MRKPNVTSYAIIRLTQMGFLILGLVLLFFGTNFFDLDLSKWWFKVAIFLSALCFGYAAGLNGTVNVDLPKLTSEQCIMTCIVFGLYALITQEAKLGLFLFCPYALLMGYSKYGQTLRKKIIAKYPQGSIKME